MPINFGLNEISRAIDAAFDYFIRALRADRCASNFPAVKRETAIADALEVEPLPKLGASWEGFEGQRRLEELCGAIAATIVANAITPGEDPA